MKYYVYNKEAKAWSPFGVDLNSIPQEERTDDLCLAPMQADGTAGEPIMYKELMLQIARKEDAARSMENTYEMERKREAIRNGDYSLPDFHEDAPEKDKASMDPAKEERYTHYLVRVVCWIHLSSIITSVLIGLSILILSLSHAKHPEVGAFIGLALGALLSWTVYAMIRSRFE